MYNTFDIEKVNRVLRNMGKVANRTTLSAGIVKGPTLNRDADPPERILDIEQDTSGKYIFNGKEYNSLDEIYADTGYDLKDWEQMMPPTDEELEQDEMELEKKAFKWRMEQAERDKLIFDDLMDEQYQSGYDAVEHERLQQLPVPVGGVIDHDLTEDQYVDLPYGDIVDAEYTVQEQQQAQQRSFGQRVMERYDVERTKHIVYEMGKYGFGQEMINHYINAVETGDERTARYLEGQLAEYKQRYKNAELEKKRAYQLQQQQIRARAGGHTTVNRSFNNSVNRNTTPPGFGSIGVKSNILPGNSARIGQNLSTMLSGRPQQPNYAGMTPEERMFYLMQNANREQTPFQQPQRRTSFGVVPGINLDNLNNVICRGGSGINNSIGVARIGSMGIGGIINFAGINSGANSITSRAINIGGVMPKINVNNMLLKKPKTQKSNRYVTKEVKVKNKVKCEPGYECREIIQCRKINDEAGATVARLANSPLITMDRISIAKQHAVKKKSYSKSQMQRAIDISGSNRISEHALKLISKKVRRR